MQASDGSGPQIRACYVAARLFCPMANGEREAEVCLRCAHFAGVLTDNSRIAFGCSWEPKATDSIPVFEFRSRAA